MHAEVVNNGAALLGDHGRRRLMQMSYTQVADILGTLADIVQPRRLEELTRYRFEDLPTRASRGKRT
ncbi:MAG: hypothetical protein ABSC06_28715 [Rhodopila sp.]